MRMKIHAAMLHVGDILFIFAFGARFRFDIWFDFYGIDDPLPRFRPDNLTNQSEEARESTICYRHDTWASFVARMQLVRMLMFSFDSIFMLHCVKTNICWSATEMEIEMLGWILNIFKFLTKKVARNDHRRKVKTIRCLMSETQFFPRAHFDDNANQKRVKSWPLSSCIGFFNVFNFMWAKL